MDKIRTIALLAALLLCNPGQAQDCAIHDYMVKLAQQQPCSDADILVRITDKSLLHTPMDEPGISAFLCCTPSQTKTIFAFAKRTGGKMTPLEFSHFLVDDLFHRKVLQALVNKSQREGMILRLDMMEIAARDRMTPKEQLDSMALAFGIPEALKQEKH